MSEADDFQARGRLRERGVAQDRRSRPFALVAADTHELVQARCTDEAARRLAIALADTLTVRITQPEQ